MDLQHIINCLTALQLNTDKKNEASFDIENILIMLLQYKKEQALNRNCKNFGCVDPDNSGQCIYCSKVLDND